MVQIFHLYCSHILNYLQFEAPNIKLLPSMARLLCIILIGCKLAYCVRMGEGTKLCYTNKYLCNEYTGGVYGTFYYSNRITINERCFENLENLYHFVSLLTDGFSSCLQQLSIQNDAFFFQFSTCNKSLASYFQNIFYLNLCCVSLCIISL